MRRKIIGDFKQRLKALRGFISLSRREIQEKYGIKTVTYTSWELGQIDHINDTSLKKLLSVFHSEGLYCTEEWLLEGKGASPFVEKSMPDLPEGLDPINQERSLFLKVNPDSVVVDILDHSMSPLYKKGDLVGGVLVNPKNYGDYASMPCIIETEDNRKKVSYFSKTDGKKFFLYGVSDLNEPLSNKDPMPIKSLYHILWHRRNPKIEG